MSISSTIARNTVFNALGRIWEGLVTLGMMIYIVDRLGWRDYGLWSFVAMFIGYAGLLDFGVGSAFTKYIAEYAARNDERGVSSVVCTGVLFYAVLGTAVTVLGWFFVDVVLDWAQRLSGWLRQDSGVLPEGGAVLDDARVLFRGALILFSLTNCILPFTAMQTGLQRMGITNLLNFGNSIVKAACIIFFLEFGFGVRGLLFANALVLLFYSAATIVVAWWIFPALRFRLDRGDVRIFSRMFDFGWRAQVGKLSNLVNFQTDRAVVALFYGLDAAGAYRAAEEVAMKMRQVPSLVVSALIPAVSEMDARADETRLSSLYLHATKYITVIAVPAAVFFFSAADLLLGAIFGEKEGLDTAAWVLRILVLGYLANILPGPGVSIALGKGHAGLVMVSGLISLVINVSLTLLFVYAFGFYGIPVATATALGISTAWFFGALRRHVDVPVATLLHRSLFWPAMASLPGFLICLAPNTWIAREGGRWEDLAALAAGGVAFGLGYAALLRQAPFLDAFDVRFLGETLKLGRLPGFRFMTRRAADV